MNRILYPPPVFQIDDGVAPQFPATLRPWASSPRASVAFAIPAIARSATESVWRVVLPADDAVARQGLALAERELEAILGTLPLAERRLPAVAVPDAFASTDHRPMAETDLRAALSGFSAQPGAPAAEFALGDYASGAWERANAAFGDALEHLRRLTVGQSWVETFSSDVLLARTLLGRAGRQATAWREGISANEAGLHARSLALAQASCAALARTIVLAVRSVTLLAPLVSGPAGMLLALPAVWKFIDDVVAEVAAARARRAESSLDENG